MPLTSRPYIIQTFQDGHRVWEIFELINFESLDIYCVYVCVWASKCAHRFVCLLMCSPTTIICINFHWISFGVWHSRDPAAVVVCSADKSPRCVLQSVEFLPFDDTNTQTHRHMNIYLNREIGNKQGKSNNNSTERIRKFISKSGAHKLCHIHIQPTLLFTKQSGKRCSDNAFQMTFRAHFKYSQIKTFNLMINYQNWRRKKAAHKQRVWWR